MEVVLLPGFRVGTRLDFSFRIKKKKFQKPQIRTLFIFVYLNSNLLLYSVNSFL